MKNLSLSPKGLRQIVQLSYFIFSLISVSTDSQGLLPFADKCLGGHRVAKKKGRQELMFVVWLTQFLTPNAILYRKDALILGPGSKI